MTSADHPDAAPTRRDHEPPPAVALLVGFEVGDAQQLRADLATVTGDLLEVSAVDDAAGAIRAATAVLDDGGLVPLAYVDADAVAPDGTASGVASAVAIHLHERLHGTRIVLVTSRASLHGVDEALQCGAVHGMITRPWSVGGLGRSVRAQLATHLVGHAPDQLDRFDGLLDDEDRRTARTRFDLQSGRRGIAPAPHPLLDGSIGPEELESRLVELLDQALGHPPRITVAPGTVLIEEDDDVGGIYLLLDGVVRLTSSTSTGERILHERSTGPILGLLALASHSRASLRVQAASDVRAIPVTIDQLSRALAAEPELSNLLVQVLITSLARRLRRSDQLQVELDQALAALSEARAQVVATARFTAVGEMAAGMAHELNNPAAALSRGLEHLMDDLAAVVDDDTVLRAVQRGRMAQTMSTAEHRAARRQLTELVGDRHLADRLLEIGVTDPEDARRLAALDAPTLARLEAAGRLGATVRSVAGAAERVVALVASLRSYLRGDDARGPLLPDVDVAAGVDDALRLVSHRLEEIEIVRHYEAVPTIRARAGALQQVWTNLITNAVDAMAGTGRLEVSVGPHGPDGVAVQVVDDGPGVDPDLVDRLFEPRFTTSGRQVRFGMGLGLSISRRIVEEHGGTIGVESRPGHTVFTVTLPRHGPGRDS